MDTTVVKVVVIVKVYFLSLLNYINGIYLSLSTEIG